MRNYVRVVRWPGPLTAPTVATRFRLWVVPMARSRQFFNRLEPIDLVSRIPFQLDPRGLVVFCLAALIIVMPNAALLGVLWQLWEPAALLSLITGGLTAWKLGQPITSWCARTCEVFYFRRLRQLHEHKEATQGRENRVGGVTPGTWVCLRDAHIERGKEHRRRHGRQAGNPPVSYTLVIATIELSGVERELAFSDGSALVWHPASPVIQRDLTTKRQSWVQYANQDQLTDAESALTALTEILAETAEAPIDEVVGKLALRFANTVLVHALCTGFTWGIVACKNMDYFRLLATLRAMDTSLNERLGDPIVQLTNAGHVWYECTAQAQAAKLRGDRMSRDKKRAPSIIFEASVGNFNYAEGDISGQTTNYYGVVSTDQVVSALEVMLKRTDVPWQSEELAGVRPVIEEAVARRTTTQAGLRPAVAKLVGMIENIGLGLAGNAVFEVLKSFIAAR
jgi:hypothetical protein